VARPSWQGDKQQKRLLAAVNRAIDHAAEVARREDEKVWEAARLARAAGIPDMQIVRHTGLNRSTLQRRLGPRPDEEPDSGQALDSPADD
jgi:DNA invertase Pin-like site-specific DNA recombinase